MKLADKVAIVTGSSSGVGKGIALALANEGAKVVVNCSRNLEGAHAVAALIRQAGGQSLVVQADVGYRAEAERLVVEARAVFGRLDILVNCAGISLRAPFEGMSEEYWETIQRTNLKGTFLCSQAALPLLKESRGVIVNVSSIHAALTTHNFSAYAASKAGIEALTRGMAVDLGKYGIRVNALRLGWILVERDAAIDEATRRKTAERLPLGRIGQVEDVMGPAVFLCSDDSRYITGSVIVVDGGHGAIFNAGFTMGLVPDGARD